MSTLATLITGDPIASVRSFAPSFAELIRATTRLEGLAWEAIDLREGPPRSDPRAFAALVITGSPHSVTERQPWMRAAEAYLRRAHSLGTPMFGICFGHQLMASAFGGRVTANPRGHEFGTLRARSLGAGGSLHWPAHPFAVHMSHGDTVAEPPATARLLATTERDAQAALHYGDACWSTQFHPEFTPAVVRCYLEHYRDILQAQGDDVEALLAAVRPCPEASALLRRFIARCVQDRGRRAGSASA